MKQFIRKITILCAFGLLLPVSGESASKLFIIGDSTASPCISNCYPRNGWGQVLQAFFRPDEVEVVNEALSGSSSKSYFTLGWPTVKNALEEGDYLFIQFGHNDQASDDRSTDPYTTYQDYLSIYIDSARAKGAIPVLLTSIHRNYWDEEDSIIDLHGDYPPAMRELAMEKNVSLIDLHALTKARFEDLGVDYTTSEIYMNLPVDVWPYYLDGREDNTHLQENGAFEVAKLVAEGILNMSDHPEMEILGDALVPAGRIGIMPNPALSGRIIGRGVYPVGEQVEVSVLPKSGYNFDQWIEADTLLSDTPSFTVTVLDSVRDFTAQLLIDTSNVRDILIYPNPTRNTITIDLKEDYGVVFIETYDVYWGLVGMAEFRDTSEVEYSFGDGKGVFFIRILVDDKFARVYRIVKI